MHPTQEVVVRFSLCHEFPCCTINIIAKRYLSRHYYDLPNPSNPINAGASISFVSFPLHTLHSWLERFAIGTLRCITVLHCLHLYV